MWLTFKAGTQERMTQSSVQRTGWRRVAGDAEGRWCSLLEGVFSVSAQRDVAGLHCQHMPFMFQVFKRNIKRLNPWCWDLFYFYLFTNVLLNCERFLNKKLHFTVQSQADKNGCQHLQL